MQKFIDVIEEHETGVADTVAKVEMHYQNEELKNMENMDINSSYVPKDEIFYQGSRTPSTKNVEDMTVKELGEVEI